MHATPWRRSKRGSSPGGGVALIRASKVPRRPEARRRSADRRQHHQARDRRADALDRHQRGDEGIHRRAARCASSKDSEGFNALTDTYRESGQGRRHRPREGRPLGAAEFLVDRLSLLTTKR